MDYDIIIDEPDASTKVPKAGKQQPAIDIWAKRTENWYGLVIDTGYKLISIIETSADYSELSGRNVRHGDELDKVTDAYGNPAKMVSGRQGAYHVYEGAKIIFEVGADGKVNKWMIFGVEEG